MIHAFGFARLGRDVEVRYSTNGDPVANLSLAFTYGRKGEDGKRPTTWIDATLWGKIAEALGPYLLKGQGVTVSLEDVHIETFKRQDGSPGSKLAARVTAIDLAGGSPEAARSPTPAPPKPQQRPAQPKTGFDDMEDDIPF